ncbi:hypothetical protein DOTSEDRAFT_49396 [Dothistroma septosporum NZE10]|uniref:Beta-lactamase-related domain-containing protein n=1 Tax=Dothistroma septosporum (strain NZE10 / CBS 128990) TaxID=675120 RepID=N1Q321_DOTSN|nr:hypothetical protein DOTSEDRAFT_49396 [Dothistroma septosporum NZE10]
MTNLAEAINLANWRDPPYNQYGFINVDKIVHTHGIKKSPDNTKELQSKSSHLMDFAMNWKGESLDLAAFIDKSETDGLIILHRGEVVHEQYSRGNSKDSKHIMMSMTKSITGLIVGILQKDGRLHVEDLVVKYVPEVEGTMYENVTIRQCIDMRSGAQYSDNNHAYRCAAGWDPADGTEKHTNLHDFIAHFEPSKAQHDGFEYVSVNTDLVGWVIERATGKKFAKVIEELLWQPMGAESDALMTVDKEGNARAAGGIAATLRDIARVGQLISEDGRDIVPSGWLHDIVNDGDSEAFARGSWAAGLKNFFSDGLAYRSHCIADRGTDTVMCLGIFGQQMMIDRKNDIVLAKTGSQEQSIDFSLIGMTLVAWKEVQRIYLAA